MIRPLKSTVTIDEDNRTVTTTFADGASLVATPSYDEESIARAWSLGYGHSWDADIEVVWQMTKQHDLLHTLIAEARGLGHSPTLYAVATGAPIPACADEEERLVMFVARALNEGVGS